MNTEPEKITDLRELQWRLIYSVIVAGKTASFAENAARRLLSGCDHDELPFAFLARFGDLKTLVRDARTGNYSKTSRSLRELSTCGMDLLTCSAAALEAIHGIGPKTARFFIIWTRPQERCAALDVHVLRWMRENGFPHAPKATPSSRRLYARLEAEFLVEADRRGMTPRQLDSQIWDERNVGGIR